MNIKTEKTYDPESHRLAEYFLKNEPDLNTVQNIKELAIEIQEAVEEWFDFAREHYK